MKLHKCNSLADYKQLKTDGKLGDEYICNIKYDDSDNIVIFKDKDNDDPITYKGLSTYTLDDNAMYLTYNVTSTSSTTKLFYNTTLTSICSTFEIDDVEVTPCTSYKFTTTGLHNIKLTFNEDLTAVSDSTFYQCTAVVNVIIPETVSSIGSSCFYGCSSLEYIHIPDIVTAFNSGVLRECPLLKDIVFPSKLTSINSYAFNGCKSLKKIKLSKVFTSLNMYAFFGCSGLESIEVDAENTVYNDGNGSNCIILTSKNLLVLGCKNTIIPNTVTGIYAEAFRGQQNIKYMVIPDSVTHIDDDAFTNCTSLMSNIKSCHFIPDSVTKISYPFQYCTGLTNLNISKNLTNINGTPFFGCYNIETITVDSENTVYNDGNGSNCIILTSNNTLIRGCDNTVIPDTVTSIGTYAFYGDTSLLEITIPSSVTSVLYYAFRDCNNLLKVIYQNIESLLNINFFNYSLKYYNIYSANPLYYALHLYFADNLNTEVTNITIPEGTTTIYPCFLSGGSFIETVSIPNSVTKIGPGAFINCSKITSIILPDNITAYDTNNICNLFDGCSSLQKIIIPNGITNLNGNEFNNCTSLQYAACLGVTETAGYIWYGTTNNCHVFLPKILTWGPLTIGTSLPLVDLGKNLTTVGGSWGAIHYCKVDYLIIRATSVPTCNLLHVLATGGIGKYIFIPSDMISAYQSATKWSNYTNYFKAIGGSEWVEIFGSSDEYADIQMYAGDRYEEIKSAYENA